MAHCSYGHLPVITGYKWDYTFYKWGCKYLELINGHNCGNMSLSESMVPQNIQKSHITNNIFPIRRLILFGHKPIV